MHAQQVHTILLFLSLLVSIFLVIAAATYAEWSHVMVVDSTTWLGLVFYLGSVPVFSLIYAAVYIVLLHVGFLPSFSADTETMTSETAGTMASLEASTALLMLAGLQFVGWLIQASLCTACELGPVLRGHEGQVPHWCPQSQFRSRGSADLPAMVATLAEAKDFTQWGMVLLSAVLVECARREWACSRLIDGSTGAGTMAGVGVSKARDLEMMAYDTGGAGSRIGAGPRTGIGTDSTGTVNFPSSSRI